MYGRIAPVGMDSMESYRRFRRAWQPKRRKRGTANSGKLPVPQTRWQPKRRKRGTANSGKLPVPQTRVVIEKEEGRQRPVQRKVTGDSDARRRLIQRKVTGDSD